MSWSSYSYNIGIYIYNLFTIECCITVFSDGCSQSLEQVLASCLQEFSRRPPHSERVTPPPQLGVISKQTQHIVSLSCRSSALLKRTDTPSSTQGLSKEEPACQIHSAFYGVHNPPLKRVYSPPTNRGSDEPSLLTSRMILFAKKLTFRSNYVFEEFKPYKVIDL